MEIDDVGFFAGFWGLREDIPDLGGYFIPTDAQGKLISVSERFTLEDFSAGHDGIVLYRPLDGTFLAVEEATGRVSWGILAEQRFVFFCQGFTSLAEAYINKAFLSHY